MVTAISFSPMGMLSDMLSCILIAIVKSQTLYIDRFTKFWRFIQHLSQMSFQRKYFVPAWTSTNKSQRILIKTPASTSQLTFTLPTSTYKVNYVPAVNTATAIISQCPAPIKPSWMNLATFSQSCVVFWLWYFHKFKILLVPI